MKFIRKLWILIFYFFIILLTGCQPIEIILHGELSGIVKDSQDNKPVATTTIILTELNDTVYTDNDGVFFFRNLIPGNYRIKVTKQHYASIEENITVKSAETEEMEINLDPIPVLQYSTSLLDFGYYNTSASFSITKDGFGNVSYLITSEQPWIMTNPTSGEIDSETDTIIVSIDKSELLPKLYNERVVIWSVYQQYITRDTIDVFAGLHKINFNENLDYGTVTDIEGTVYKTIEIGDQTWMAENLKTTRYNNNIPIPEVTDEIAWLNLETPGFCWYDNDSTAYRAVSGALYNSYVVRSGNICPTGWHVPTYYDWNGLIEFIGGSEGGGIKLKEAGGLHWDPSVLATNEFGFTAVPSGWRYNIVFQYSHLMSVFWTSTEIGNGYLFIAGVSGLESDDFEVMGLITPPVTNTTGLPIRCINDL
jgi:uncharacterized protein (TIGR02145 family)